MTEQVPGGAAGLPTDAQAYAAKQAVAVQAVPKIATATATPATSRSPVPEAAPPDDTLAITVGGYRVSGWKTTRMRRSLEEVPSSFDVSLTEKYPAVPDELVIKPGDPCVVTIGADTVLTGYVDRYEASIASNDHTVRIVGRSKVEDLVDCSILWDGYQILGTDAADIAAKLASPYGVGVKLYGDPGKPIPVMGLNLSDKPFRTIEVAARYAPKLIYDDADGDLVLADLGTDKHASGFQQGANVQRATIGFSADGRFSDYRAFLSSTASLTDPTNIGNQQGDVVHDGGVTRFRLLDTIDDEGNTEGQYNRRGPGEVGDAAPPRSGAGDYGGVRLVAGHRRPTLDTQCPRACQHARREGGEPGLADRHRRVHEGPGRHPCDRDTHAAGGVQHRAERVERRGREATGGGAGGAGSSARRGRWRGAVVNRRPDGERQPTPCLPSHA